MLRVKATTCNTIVLGECGRIPPSIFCHIKLLCFYNRVQALPVGNLVKMVFNELNDLHAQGFGTWVSRAHDLMNLYCVNTTSDFHAFKKQCQSNVINHFKCKWRDDMNAFDRPFLRTYCLFKSNFESESYLIQVKDVRYRSAISKLRCSSHTLEIERGRYNNPPVPAPLRICKICNLVEDEEHFVTKCALNETERLSLYGKIRHIYPSIDGMSNRQKFIFLMSSIDCQVQKWFGKFIFDSFISRTDKM